jgi:hypothetical protein
MPPERVPDLSSVSARGGWARLLRWGQREEHGEIEGRRASAAPARRAHGSSRGRRRGTRAPRASVERAIR